MRRYLIHIATFLAGGACFWVLQALYQKGQEDVRDDGPHCLDLSLREDQTYRVRRVIDGDTLVLENGLHVRYAGINTPELGHYIKDPVPLADRARQRNAELVEGKRIRLTFAQEPLDAHGRIVAHISSESTDGQPLSLEETLLREGLARALGLGLSADEYGALKAAQEEARSKKIGIWGWERPKPEAGGTAYAYCASGDSPIFHRSDCPGAERIPPAHFMGYPSLEAAVAAGRRLCSQCIRALEKPKTAKPDKAR